MGDPAAPVLTSIVPRRFVDLSAQQPLLIFAAIGGAAGVACLIASPSPAAVGLVFLSLLVAGAELARRRAGGRPTPAAAASDGAATTWIDRLQAFERRAAQTHPLTGQPTREKLLEDMEADLSAGRGPLILGAIRFIEFDRLAAFDQAGAAAALRRFAERIAGAVSSAHTFGQIDRNVVACWFRQGDAESAAAEFRSLVHVACRQIDWDGDSVTPSVEAAMICATGLEDDPAHMLLRVHAALSQAGAPGDAPVIVPPEPVAVARERFQLEQGLARAISEDQLALVFQPVADLDAGRLLGAEALLRWDHPQLGPISPSRFVPLLEHLGLSDRYGMWVLNAACREARRWADEGVGGLKLAVNLSARQIGDAQLPAKIERTLQRHGVAPEALELELTETAAMADAARSQELFARLRASGVSLSIDDFGAGWSSLSYLRRLPFDKLKIDREFVTAVDRRRDSRAICKALIELGRGLGLTVLAEGVETADEVRTLRELGCSVFQGYFISHPLSGDDLLRHARDPSWLSERLAPAHPLPSSSAA